jgi:hypothetical protein
MLIIDYRREVSLSLSSNAIDFGKLPYFKPGNIEITQELSATIPPRDPEDQGALPHQPRPP